MANSWFRFKQFIIHQDRCAMKVGTDGVLLGALTDVSGAGRILDIGTGTGLVALMLAQRSDAFIDAVEVDAPAASQAKENMAASPWDKRIRVIHQSFENYFPECDRKYDLIVANPPYFRNSLKSEKYRKAIARHAGEDFYEQLFRGVSHLLSDKGTCSLILPAARAGELEKLALAGNLYPHKCLSVRSHAGGKVIRKLMTWGREEAAEVSEEELLIYKEGREYTAVFKELVGPYYLY